ncbi:DEAH-box ATP-dependent RNA helicase prp22, partial [Coemansia nantahalensis]
MGARSELEQLEYLSLVNKVTGELSNHTGISDKDVSEYIIHLHDESKGFAEFQSKLDEDECGFTDALVRSLFHVISAMKPKQKSDDAQKSDAVQASDKAAMFPGLSIANTRATPSGEASRALDDDISRHINSLGPEQEPGPESQNHERRPRWDDAHGRDSRRSEAVGLDEAPVIHRIYRGRVTNLRDFGAFVALDGVQGRVEGLVHVSAIRRHERVENPREVLERGQQVRVKVMSITGTKFGLSMKDVDQDTGEDLSPALRPGVPADEGAGGGGQERSLDRMTSPERWEIKQLIASGVLDRSDYPELDEVDEDGMPAIEDDGEELDIELREEEPEFLRGHAIHALQLSPVKVVKAPDGSLNRAALAGASLAKERKELKQQQTEAEMDNLPKDLNRPWEDPMPAPGERNFAQDLRGVAAEAAGRGRGDVPEWRSAVQGKAVTYGKLTDLSIQEQRRSLPVFKLRDLFIEA